MSDIAPQVRAKRVRSLLWFSLATGIAVLLAATALILRAEQGTVEFSPAPAFPALKDELGEVARVAIEWSEGKIEAARLDDGRWVIPAKGNYPARFENVKTTIAGLSTLELIEAKTANPQWHERLDLVAPADKGKGIAITLYNAAGEELAALIAGKIQDMPTPGVPGTLYVRRAGEEQTYLARGFLTVRPDEADWLDKNLLDIARERIKRVAVEIRGQPSYALTRESEAEANFKMENVPAGEELASETAANGVGSGLSGLSFDDALPAAEVKFSRPSKIAYTTFDGLVVTITLIEEDEKFFAAIAAKAEGENADAVREAEAINAVAANWAYVLPRYKGAILLSPRDSLLKPASEAPAPEPAPVPQ